MKKIKKIAIILGTRPEIIKLSPIIHELVRRNCLFFIIHTGQHYSFNMDRIFFDDLVLPRPAYQLNTGSHSHGKQTGLMLERIEKILEDESPDIVITQGDTNSVLAGALAAVKLHIPVAHVEAGLRSNDRQMPEEINRILTDRISDFCFVPTKKSMQNLLNEGFGRKAIFITGNTIVDSVFANLKVAQKKSKISQTLHIIPGSYFFITIHRAENVDDKKNLNNILTALRKVSSVYDIKIIWPIHPRTLTKINNLDIRNNLIKIKNLHIIEPVGYFDSLILQSNAIMVMTDSGGIQEESCILHTPCITLRENTERPETIDVGANILCGTDSKKILRAVNFFLKTKKDWKNPFGKGDASKKILNIIYR